MADFQGPIAGWLQIHLSGMIVSHRNRRAKAIFPFNVGRVPHDSYVNQNATMQGTDPCPDPCTETILTANHAKHANKMQDTLILIYDVINGS